MYKIGIDLGGTKIEGIILDDANEEYFRYREKIDQNSDYSAILHHIQFIYNCLAKEINNAPHSLGIGTPGSISPKKELLRFCNIVAMNGQPLLKDLQISLQRKLTIENDANCFILAEQQLGAAKGNSSAFGIIIGTGCGGGYVVNDKLVSGANKIAGEWGHSVININGTKCYCGRKGCIEQYLGGRSLQRAYEDLSGINIGAEKIIELYRQKQEHAIIAIDQYLDYFGIALANLVTTIDPDIIVVGGGLSNIAEIYTDGLNRVKAQFSDDEIKPKIIKNTLGDSSGVIGAALLGV